MYDLLLGAAVAAPLVAFVAPLVAISRVNKRIGPMDGIASASRQKRPTNGTDDRQRAWSENEFAFHRAINAYEELIDRTAGRLP
jgi:hypothetical protein